MKNRREFVKIFFGQILTWGLLCKPAFSAVRLASARKKIAVPFGTPRETLVNQNPKDVDATDLELTPLSDFKTMGLDDLEIDITDWRLKVDGEVRKPLVLNFSEITATPALERKVLLICPGIFVNNGVWTGISVRELLRRADASQEVTHITFRGPEGSYEKVLRVPIKDISSDKVFLAYRVNSEVLPRKHGFPLRVVAEGYYGYDWVKYVYKVTAEILRS